MLFLSIKNASLNIIGLPIGLITVWTSICVTDLILLLTFIILIPCEYIMYREIKKSNTIIQQALRIPSKIMNKIINTFYKNTIKQIY